MLKGLFLRNLYMKGYLCKLRLDYTTFNGNGKLKAIGNYNKGRRKDGLWETYNQKGNLKSKGYYRNDKKDGPWEVYDSDGQLKIQRNFINGREIE